MSTDTTTNFLGIPVTGDINRADPRTPQRPLSELEPLLRAVLGDETIADFGWRQYTPYFNDGEPCVFRVREPWFRTAADVKEGEEDWPDATYDFELSDHPSLGERPYRYNDETRTYEPGAYEGPDEARYDRVRALAEAVGSGAFNDVLLEAFGDQAQVRVSRSGIQVDSYEHD